MSDLKVSLALAFRDEASKALQKSVRDGTKTITGGAKEQKKSTDDYRKSIEASRKAVQQQAGLARQASRETARQIRTVSELRQRADRSRELLGIRSEQTIRREIAQTTAAYQRLARSGTASAREQARAYDAMHRRVHGLRTELGQVSKMQRLMAAGSVVAGVAAGAQAFVAPVRQQMSFEAQLAQTANSAVAGRDVAGRAEGIKEIRAAVRQAVHEGGGSRDQALAAYGKLVSHFSADETAKILPIVQKTATGTGADATQLATVVNALKNKMGIEPAEDIRQTLNMMVKSGQEMGVELTDLLAAFPQQLVAASKAGMTGKEGVAQLLSADQVALKNVADLGEAAPRITALLEAINSKPGQMAMSRIMVDKPGGGKQGIDLAATLAGAQRNGMSQIDAIVALSDLIINSDSEISKLKKSLKDGNLTDEQKANTQAAIKTRENFWFTQMSGENGSVIASLRNSRDEREENLRVTREQMDKGAGEGAAELNFQTMASTNEYKTAQLAGERKFASDDAMKKLADTMGGTSQRLANLSNEFPALSAAVSGATTAIQAMTQAALAFTALRMLGGGVFKNILSGTGSGIAARGAGIAGTGVAGLAMPLALGTMTSAWILNNERQDNILKKKMRDGTLDDSALTDDDRERVDRMRRVEEIVTDYRNKPGIWDGIKSFFTPDKKSAEKQHQFRDKQRNLYGSPPDVPSAHEVAAASQGKTGGRADNPPPPPVQITTRLELDGRQIAETVNQYNELNGIRTTGTEGM